MLAPGYFQKPWLLVLYHYLYTKSLNHQIAKIWGFRLWQRHNSFVRPFLDFKFFSIFQDDPRASFSLFSPAGSIDLLSGIGFNHTIFKCSLQIYFNIFFSIQSSTISNFQIILDFTFHVYCEKKFFPGFLLFLLRLISKY